MKLIRFGLRSCCCNSAYSSVVFAACASRSQSKRDSEHEITFPMPENGMYGSFLLSHKNVLKAKMEIKSVFVCLVFPVQEFLCNL